MPEQQLLEQAVFAPSLPTETFESVRITDSVSPLEVAVWVCVDPRGRVSHAFRSRPGPSQALVQPVTERLLHWRVIPARHDGEPIHTCAQLSVSISFGLEPQPQPPNRDAILGLPFAPPLSFRPAIPIHRYFLKLRDVRLDWPRFMRWRGWTRSAAVDVCIDARGRPTRTRTSRRIAPKLDKALRELVSRWRFEPMLLDGVPHESCMTLRFIVLFPRRS